MNYPFENDTSAVIKKLARKSVRFDKKKNLFCLSAIIVAVAMIMMSLLTVQNIIYQNQKEIEGLHQGIFFDITQDSKEKLLANEEVKSVGLSCNIKTVKENSKELSLIYYDDDMLSLIPAFFEVDTGGDESADLVLNILKAVGVPERSDGQAQISTYH